MCGILGIFGSTHDIEPALLRSLNALKHRGPDGAATKIHKNFAFGHTLLSIIGPKPTPQPIQSRDGKIDLVFNGEIYNYLELLNEHSELKSRCSGKSDAEVLVEGFAEFGIQFISKLNGIFAIAYHDHKTQKSYLIRDRLGVKPIYYSNKNSPQVAFASELQPLSILLSHDGKPDINGYYSYVRFRQPLFSSTYFKNIKTLRPGRYLEIHNDQFEEVQYWSPAPSKLNSISYEEAEEHMDELFQSSIRLQMRSHRAVSSFLSGGVDSSLISALASDVNTKLDTFSLGFDQSTFDETPWARLVSRQIHSQHHELKLSGGEFSNSHRDLVQHLRHPVSVPNQVGLYRLSQEISKSHRCILSGEGADEVFGGYGRIFLLPHDFRLAQQEKTFTGTYSEFFIQRYNYLSHERAQSLLAPYFDQQEIQRAKDRLEFQISEELQIYEQADTYLQTLLLFQSLHLPVLLHRLDTASMAHSVEARVPFLDHRIVEFANALPMNYKMKRKIDFDFALQQKMSSKEISETHDIPKFILKNIAQRHLPKEIVFRKKMGFPIPDTYVGDFDHWVSNNLKLSLEGSEV